MQPHLHRGMRDRHSRRHTEQHGVHPAGTEQPHDGHRAIRLLGVVWRPMVAGHGIVVGYSHTPCRITPCHCAHHHSTSCMAARGRRNTVPVHSVHQCGQCASPLPIAAHSTHCDATILPTPQVLKASQGCAEQLSWHSRTQASANSKPVCKNKTRRRRESNSQGLLSHAVSNHAPRTT